MYYSYHKSVLLVVVCLSISCIEQGSAATHGSPRDDPHFPCPIPEDIEPCTCYYDAELSTLCLDCSHVKDSDQLAQVFQAPFPVSTFQNFTIDSNEDLFVIKNDTFNGVTFEEIWISWSVLEKIQINAFAGMESTLKRLFLYHNEISKFPFFVLDNYVVLEALSLISNDITYVPSIKSRSLKYLELGLNPIDNMPVNPFIHLPKLEKLHVEAIGLTELKQGLFEYNCDLNYISLWGNELRHLEPYWFSFPGADSMKQIVLNHNFMSVVHKDAFSGVSGSHIYMEFNEIETIKESVWRHVLQGNNTIYLLGNHLQCGCDVAWLVWDRPLLDQLVEAKCSDGQYLVNLDPDSFSGCETTTTQSSITTFTVE
ncbi:unnamed protein product [Meganyctiphanes norvegica]|uniref:Uncharacterized protein n=1 Tax=Meganyctiphanes norvegica TaxID=48144 RepID=A0AAV2S810_MEGNR